MNNYKEAPIYRAFVDTMLECIGTQKPIVKEIRQATGSGKTYYAVRAAIDLFLENQVCTIYMAPLKKLVEDFTADFKYELRQRGLNIPVYRLYARADFEDNDAFLSEVEIFAAEVKMQFSRQKSKQNLELFNEDIPRADADVTDDAVDDTDTDSVSEMVQTLERKIAHYRMQKKYVKTGYAGPEAEEDLRRSLMKIMGLTRTMCTGIVKNELLNNHRKGLFKNPSIRPVLEKIDPLNLFKHEPGIIVTTGSKVSTNASEIVVEKNRMQIDIARRRDFEDYYKWAEHTGSRLYLLIDEEESCYAYAQEALKKTLTKKDVDQHRFIYAFFHYFDVAVIRNYERAAGRAFARKMFNATQAFSANLKKIAQVLNDKTLMDRAQGLAKLECFASFSASEVAFLVEDYFAMQDSEMNFKTLKLKLNVMKHIIGFLEARRGKNDAQAGSCDLFDDYLRLCDVMHDKKRMMAHKDLIRSHRKEFDYIFFNERLEIFNHAILSGIYVRPLLAGCNLELVSADRILDPVNNFSLGDFLEFIMLLTRITMTTQISGGDGKMQKVTDNQAKVLRDYKGKLGKWGLDKSALNDMMSRNLPEHLDEEYVFNRSKFVLSIIEEDADAPEYSNDLRWMSLMATVQKKTPERQLIEFTRADNQNLEVPRNAVAVMSATGGSSGCWGSYNFGYIRDRLQAAGGGVYGPTPEELRGMVEFREKRLALRQVTVADFTRADFREKIGVSPLFKEVRKDVMVQFQQDAHPSRKPNPYKIDELDYVFAILDALASTHRRSAAVFTQSVLHVKRVIEGMADQGIGFSRSAVHGHYRFEPEQFGLEGDAVMVILYSSKFGKEIGAHRIINGEVVEIQDEDVEIEDADFTLLENVLDERFEKVLFIAPFKAAGRGLSLTPKCQLNNGVPHPRDKTIGKKDFDILMIAMSPYYDGLYRTPDSSINQMERLVALLNHLYNTKRLSATTHADLPQLVQEEHETAFLPEYYRYVGREMIQTFGRVERVEGTAKCGAPDHQWIFINREIVVELAHFFKLEPTIVARLSANNWRVHDHVQEFQARTRLHPTEEEWHAYCEYELDLDERFVRASKSLYRGFHRQAMRDVWEAMRSPEVLIDPAAYIQEIKALSPPMQHDDWSGFVEYAFRERTVEEFYLATVKDAHDHRAKPIQVYSDLYHGKGSKFEPADYLAPLALRNNAEFATACRNAGVNLDALFKTHLPRPRFFFDYIKGYFAELIFAQLLKLRKAVLLLNAASHPQANDIFERFDFYVDRHDKVLALDVKSWGRNAERLLSKKLQENALRKTHIVAKALEKKVEPCYINLYGEKPMMSEIIDGQVVRFFNIFVMTRDDQGYPAMELNRRLFAYMETGNV